MTARTDILRQLATVSDPCSLLMGSPIDICALGLVESVTEDGGHVAIELCLTDTSCVHFGGLRAFITDKVMALPGISTVEVTHTTAVLWTPDRMAPA